jgi:serine/threonine-protein kinase
MKSIGKYQVIEELGGSATGTTYRARDAFRNREFAVKILTVVPGLTAAAKEQFCAHLAACAELTHRHIAKVHDLGEVEEGIFVATEWRSGMGFERFMQENADLPLGQKLAVVAQVAEGLAFAHSRDIAHGDLKPSNIYIDGARDVSILDFGVAKWLAALLAAGSRTEGLMANYLAPEQVLGQPFDARSDIFALGLILYQFASGKYPFSSDPSVIAREIVHSEPAPLTIADGKIPQELQQLVVRALKKDPEQRLQTAEEFASGLYLAAQQLRRAAVSTIPIEPVPVEPMAETPVGAEQDAPQELQMESLANGLPPLPGPEPLVPKAVPMALTDTAAPRDAAPKVRERPQDAEPAARPWSARSYAAGSSRPPVVNTNIPKQPVSATPPPQRSTPLPSVPATGSTPVVAAPIAPPPRPPAAAPSNIPAPAAATPAFQPPQSFLPPSLPPREPAPASSRPSPGKISRRVLIAAAGLILAGFIVGSLVSRQNLHASQEKIRATAAEAKPAVPREVPAAISQAPLVPAARAPKSGESGPDDLGNPQFSARQTLSGPVRSLWEAGRYAAALGLVEQVLASDPANEEARVWKKKIRAAQAAEAALK